MVNIYLRTHGAEVKYPYTFFNLKEDNPNTSFPSNLSPEDLAEFDVFPVAYTQAPAVQPHQKAVQDEAPTFVDGQWTLLWQVVDKTAQELEAESQRLQQTIVGQTQQRLDTFARTRNYDNILSAATYATSTIPKFAAEGQRAVDLRDQTWATLYQILADVQAGTRPMPTSFADIEPDLPELTWTN